MESLVFGFICSLVSEVGSFCLMACENSEAPRSWGQKGLPAVRGWAGSGPTLSPSSGCVLGGPRLCSWGSLVVGQWEWRPQCAGGACPLAAACREGCALGGCHCRRSL